MIFLALKTEDGRITGKISFYCRMLGISRQGFYKYLANKDRPWKYQDLADAMKEIINEDECNDTYGRIRMYQALLLKQPEGVHIPSERTVYRVMDQIGLSHRPRRKPNGLTKADREAMKSDDLLKRDFHSDAPLEKCITDITEIPASNGKLYVSAIFDCFDLSVLGLAMETNMKADLCIRTLENALTAYPTLEGAVIHSDRGTQYTSEVYRQAIQKYHIQQSMNSAGGRCHDNARCESMWARMKTELLYDRYDTKQMTVEELKVLIWRYFLSYWNNRRICSDQVFTELTRLQHERGETALNTQYRVSTEGMPKELLTKPKVSLESKSIPPALNNCSEPKAMAAAHGSGEAITGMDTVWRTDLRDGEKHAPYHHKYRYRKIELPWVYEQMGPCRTCKTNKGAYFNYATS